MYIHTLPIHQCLSHHLGPVTVASTTGSIVHVYNSFQRPYHLSKITLIIGIVEVRKIEMDVILVVIISQAAYIDIHIHVPLKYSHLLKASERGHDCLWN